VDENTWLIDQFEGHRGRLKAVASRVLGSSTEADDAVQETWIRFNRSDTSSVDNLGAWLTTVVSRVCLNILQSRRAKPLAAAEAELDLAEPEAALGASPGPEQEVVLADSVGLALLVVLDDLTPPERVALVLHDMFGVPFEEIGPIIARNAAAARQLASRARRQVQGQGLSRTADRVRQARVVEAFLAASRRGDFEALLNVLHPDVVMRADGAATRLGAPAEVRGRERVAGFARRARGARAALVDGRPGAVGMQGGRLRVVFVVTVEGDSIVAIDVVAEPDYIKRADVILT
jgi:RNA polymerase sigma factor (sigma-70 family)